MLCARASESTFLYHYLQARDKKNGAMSEKCAFFLLIPSRSNGLEEKGDLDVRLMNTGREICTRQRMTQDHTHCTHPQHKQKQKYANSDDDPCCKFQDVRVR